MKFCTSLRKTRLFMPVPLTLARSTPSSRANFRTAGLAWGLRPADCVSIAESIGTTFAGADLANSSAGLSAFGGGALAGFAGVAAAGGAALDGAAAGAAAGLLSAG